MARLRLPLGRPADRRGEHRRDRPRRLPRRARRLPRRRQPARAGPVRPPAPRSRRACCAASPRRPGPGVHLSPPRRGVVEMTARSWPMYPRGRHRGDRAATSRRRRARAASRSRTSSSTRRARRDRRARSASPLARVPLSADLRRRAAQLRPGRRARRAARTTRHGWWCAARSWSAPAGELPAGAASSPRGRATAASRGASSPARRSSASPATSTSRAPRSRRTLGPLRRARPRAAPGAPSSSRRCSPARTDCWLHERRRPPHERAARRRG